MESIGKVYAAPAGKQIQRITGSQIEITGIMKD